MDITETIIAVAIALIHPYFFHKLVDQILGYNTINKMCNHIKFDINDNSTYKQCQTAKDSKLDHLELSRHVTLLVIALLSILICSMIRQKSTKLGIGVGGIILLICSLTMYWRNYNEVAKLIILGISLAIIVYISIRLYTVKSIADIFSLEFGTKSI